jgi:hypothetical protein
MLQALVVSVKILDVHFGNCECSFSSCFLPSTEKISEKDFLPQLGNYVESIKSVTL